MRRILALCLLTIAGSSALGQQEEWQIVDQQADLTVYNRARAGSNIRELRAVGRFDVPNWVLKNVLDDAEHYARFMPFVVESRVIARNPTGHTLVGYMRVKPPLISERDYTIRVHDSSHRAASGATSYESRWELANDFGPPEKPGTVRIKINEGSWLLEPMPDGKSTRATYMLFTDGGGGLPTLVVNQANKHSIPEMFEALRKQTHEPRYQAQPAR